MHPPAPRLTSCQRRKLPRQKVFVVLTQQRAQLGQRLLISRCLICGHSHRQLQELQGCCRHLLQQGHITELLCCLQRTPNMAERQRLAAARHQPLITAQPRGGSCRQLYLPLAAACAAGGA